LYRKGTDQGVAALEILRQGSNRKSGWTLIRVKKPPVVSVEADSKGGARVTLTLKKTIDPERNGEYDHEVRLSLSDISAVIEALAGLGISKFSEEISGELSHSARSLNRLLAAASGIEVRSDSGRR
jgi:hypothetical protein